MISSSRLYEEQQPEVLLYSDLKTLQGTLDDHFESLGLPELNTEDLALLDDAIAVLNPPEAVVRVVEVNTFTESEHSIVRGDCELAKSRYSLSQKALILVRQPSQSESLFFPVTTSVVEPEKQLSASAAPHEGSAFEAAAGSTGGGVESKEQDSLKDTTLSSSGAPKAAGVVSTTALVTGKADNKADIEAGRGRQGIKESPPTVAAPASNIVGSDGVSFAALEANIRPWREMPEIILFWARNRRSGGNLIVCPDKSMDRLVQAYLVCEIVESTIKTRSGRFMSRQGSLLGVELGEALPSDQDELQSLLSNFSFMDASFGVVSLSLSIYYFGVLAKNDVNVLTLLAVAVVAGLNQEATWPWEFNLILKCSQIDDPMVKVAQCKRVHNHTGQQSGQGFLAIGLAVFGMYLEVWPVDDSDRTPIVFRILLNGFQAAMIMVLIINMIQAASPMVFEVKQVKYILHKWAFDVLEETVADTVWYLTLLVTLLWAGVIAAVACTQPFDGDEDSKGISIFIMVAVVLAASFVTINPGMFFLGAWGLIWLIPTGLAFVFRSAFDMCNRFETRVSLGMRRMARELSDHVRNRAIRRCSVADVLVLLLQVLPLIPLLLVFVPLPLLYLLTWTVHLLTRMFLLLSDAIVAPVSSFRLYPLLSDYGSVTWRMAALDMDVERSSMRTLLKRRVSKLLETGKIGDMKRSGVFPEKLRPYSHLRTGPNPRLGCAAIVLEDRGDETVKVLKISSDDSGDAGRRERERSRSNISTPV